MTLGRFPVGLWPIAYPGTPQAIAQLHAELPLVVAMTADATTPDASLQAELPLEFVAIASVGAIATLNAELPLTFAAFAARSGRPTRCRMPAVWGAATANRQPLRAPWAASQHVQPALRAPWGAGQTLRAATAAPWAVSTPIGKRMLSPWGQFLRWLRAEEVAPWGTSRPVDSEVQSPWGSYARHLHHIEVAIWGTARPVDVEARAPWGGPMVPTAQRAIGAWSAARPVDREGRFPWGPKGRSVRSVVVVVIPNNPTPDEPIDVVPIRRAYVTTNSINLTTAAGGQLLRAASFDLSLDAASWTFDWSATLEASALPLVTPADAASPVEVIAEINGVDYHLLVLDIKESKKFPTQRISVAGQGTAAFLGGKYSPVLTFANDAERTAQQLMEDVLQVNGVALDWAVEFGLEDNPAVPVGGWNVPAGAWVFRGTYMEALADIAQAAGGYIQPHRSEATLRVLPYYPKPPWEWSELAADVELAADAVETEATAWVKRPDYNRVYVGGVAMGVFGPVTRAGSAGDLVAEQVSHALITGAHAHRQRGIRVLADTGRQAHLTLTLPVLAETGLILPGTLLDYGSRRGLVRRLQLNWQRPKMRQTISVETHEIEEA